MFRSEKLPKVQDFRDKVEGKLYVQGSYDCLGVLKRGPYPKVKCRWELEFITVGLMMRMRPVLALPFNLVNAYIDLERLCSFIAFEFLMTSGLNLLRISKWPKSDGSLYSPGPGMEDF